MKPNFLFFVALMLLAIQGWAAPVDLNKAQMVAQNFTMTNGNLYASTVGGGIRLAYSQQSDKIKDQPVFYVFNSGNGFIIVSGDDRAEEILAYGEGKFDINDIPDGMRCLLDIYKEQIEYLQINPKLKVEKNTPSLMATSVSALLSTKCGQGSPYYNQCPSYDSNSSHHCVTGCVATAMSQIMQYWKYPSSAPAMSAYTTATNKIKVSALSSRTLTWSTSNDAVAWLMRYAGQSVQMDYGQKASSAQSDPNAINAFVNKFQYSSSATFIYKDSYSNTEWNTKLKAELNAGRPVYYRASHKNSNGKYSGHAFIVDGYNTSGQYHINWGWNGSYSGSNTFFALNAFNPDTLKFNYGQAMIVDLRPMTILSINPNPVALTSKTVGKTYTAKISIKGYNLTGSLKLTLSGSGVFTIDKTSITKSAATAGATVTVTYKPTAAGTQNATITISGGGLTSNKTVKLTGTAVKREITVKPAIVSFIKVPKGNSRQKTFTVTGTNLTGPLTVKLTDATGMFSINKTSITASQAANGCTVTVTYSPTATGVHVAYVTISGGDALEDKKVTLKGSCIKNSGNNAFNVLDNVDFLGETMTVVTDGVTCREDDGTSVMAPSNSPTGTDGSASDATEYSSGQNGSMTENTMTAGMDELASNSKIYAEGQTIIIESAVEQSAVICDVAGHAQSVNLQTGRNEIPVDASGIYIVRTRDKSAKLMIK